MRRHYQFSCGTKSHQIQRDISIAITKQLGIYSISKNKIITHTTTCMAVWSEVVHGSNIHSITVASILGTSGNHQKTDPKANAYIQNQWKHSAEHTISLNAHSSYMYTHPHAHVHTYMYSTCSHTYIHTHQ